MPEDESAILFPVPAKLFVLVFFLAPPVVLAAAAPPFASSSPPAETSAWREKVTEMLPLLGHRNWIAIVDSAYPLQVSPGVETVETNSSLIGVLHFVLGAIGHSEHVGPEIFMDAELPFLTEQDAPGAARYRANVADVLRGYPVQSMLHDKIIADLDQTGRTFQVLVLKTNLTIPYSSVFIRLNCKYWGNDAERRLREKMAGRSGH